MEKMILDLLSFLKALVGRHEVTFAEDPLNVIVIKVTFWIGETKFTIHRGVPLEELRAPNIDHWRMIGEKIKDEINLILLGRK